MGSVTEGNTEPKTERFRCFLKWLILASVLTLIVIVAVGIPMVLKISAPTSTSSSKSVVDRRDPLRPNHGLRPLQASNSPSVSPTGTAPPSLSPTITAQPTTDRPSLRPSSSPTTSQPTEHPTNHPTMVPPTMAPTIDPNHDFKLRLFWQKGYYWQESWEESWFCVECTKCDSYGVVRKVSRDALNSSGAISNSSFVIPRKMELTMAAKNEAMASRQIVEKGICFGSTDAGTEAPSLTSLTMEIRACRKRLMKVVKCDKNDKSQQWAPIDSLSKFELRPFEDDGLTEDEAKCVSQLHHPKNEEILSMYDCKTIRIYETRYWEEYKG
eukprot:scaffold2214_cov139-Cylindrotheca_fusiformis.AAC.37